MHRMEDCSYHTWHLLMTSRGHFPLSQVSYETPAPAQTLLCLREQKNVVYHFTSIVPDVPEQLKIPRETPSSGKNWCQTTSRGNRPSCTTLHWRKQSLVAISDAENHTTARPCRLPPVLTRRYISHLCSSFHALSA